MYVYALGLIAAADVTALFSSNTAFIYAFSWIWLNERIQLLPARVSKCKCYYCFLFVCFGFLFVCLFFSFFSIFYHHIAKDSDFGH